MTVQHTVLVALLVVAVVVGAFAKGWFFPGGGPFTTGAAGGSVERQREASQGWGRVRDAERNGLLLRQRSAYDRLSLGWLTPKQVLAAPPRASVALFAPTLSGKTTKFVVHRVLEWQGALVATSAKADLVRLTMARRQQQGPVWVFDPLQMLRGAGIATCHWSPLQHVTSYPAALQAARWIASTSSVEGGSSTQKFWDDHAERMLAPLLFAAAQRPGEVAGVPTHEQHVRQVRRWLEEGVESDAQVRAVLRLAGDRDALDALTGVSTTDDRTRKNIAATALQVLAPFAHPRTSQALTPTGDPACDFDADQLLDEGGTLYVFAPEHEAAQFKTLFETIINTVAFAAQDRSAAAGGLPIEPHHLLLALDEAANMASLRTLPQLASVGSSQGIVLMSVWQNMSQPDSIYGTNGARTLLAGHNAKLFWGGIHDDATLRYVQAMCGEFEVTKTSTTRDRDRHSRSTSSELRPLASADYVRTLSSDRVLVLLQNAKPFRVALRAWYADPAARALIDPTVAAQFDAAFAGAASAPRTRRRSVTGSA